MQISKELQKRNIKSTSFTVQREGWILAMEQEQVVVKETINNIQTTKAASTDLTKAFFALLDKHQTAKAAEMIEHFTQTEQILY